MVFSVVANDSMHKLLAPAVLAGEAQMSILGDYCLYDIVIRQGWVLQQFACHCLGFFAAFFVANLRNAGCTQVISGANGGKGQALFSKAEYFGFVMVSIVIRFGVN